MKQILQVTFNKLIKTETPVTGRTYRDIDTELEKEFRKSTSEAASIERAVSNGLRSIALRNKDGKILLCFKETNNN